MEVVEGATRGGLDGHLLVELNAMRALGLHQQMDPGAEHALEVALEMAAPTGTRRIFVLLGEAMRAMIQGYVVGGGTQPFASKVLEAFEALPSGRPMPGSPRPTIQLSDRERQVLKLAAKGLTNDQIARQLVISVNTVKTHYKRINAKLQVGNRTAAVNRASELSLI